ncbi:MAG: hypothetical protein ACKVHE_25310 [Planctomycetales bacterium]
MSDSIKELLETAKDVLLRCWIFGFVLLFIWLGAILLMGNLIHDLHGPMFGLTNHELDLLLRHGNSEADRSRLFLHPVAIDQTGPEEVGMQKLRPRTVQ